jgi:hypothetical protein
MSFSYLLLQLPPFVLLVLIVSVFMAIGVAGTHLVRKYGKHKYQRAHNELVGYVFAVVGGFYGLLLGFVVFLVWDASNSAQADASKEGSLARGLYRDIIYHPDTAMIRPLRNSYVIFVHSIVEKEYPGMEQMKPYSTFDRKYFNDVFIQLEKLDANDTRVQQMFHTLTELATARSLRELDGSSEIAIEIWIPLLIGALILLYMAMLVDVENRSLHKTLTGLLGGFIGLVIYIIVMLDHPFTGTMKIDPTEYKTILQMENEGG